ncbi:large conductance mechanosensitive channel protein MscL [Planomonospora venezuelensis]|uniref:Large-conductance mechanosensitive channel n=1 Tax=Planomonospora venezuelensis TaxID=1999 RepID=A0A841D2B8_PLAVE|nr:large conductance mechanosensitive channel protein MscL [Planomonospora venezuelensis]MBB5962654.1 large conductance mechanosensitive channel [Planomonospora venezuelensis]GIN01590.1 large-conductance mechanosensitive channel [Planomonospora venezuelensis]
MLSGFKKFLLRGNVLELAVAVMIGTAFNAIVQSLVKDVFTPMLAAIGGQPRFEDLVLHVGSSPIRYGVFLNAVFSFLIMAAVVYFFVITPYEKLTARFSTPEETTLRECPECLSEIPKAAVRCSHCTAQIAPMTDDSRPAT